MRKGESAEGLTCKVETGKALVEAGLHPRTGGTGLSACSGDMLLEALVACAGVTLNAVATALGIELRDAAVQAEGDLDFRGTLGVAKDAPVGFQDIRLQFTLDTDASEEQIATLLRLTERYCVVYQTLARPPVLSASASEPAGRCRPLDRRSRTATPPAGAWPVHGDAISMRNWTADAAVAVGLASRAAGTPRDSRWVRTWVARCRASADAPSGSVGAATNGNRASGVRRMLSASLSSTAARGGFTLLRPASKLNSRGTSTVTAPSLRSAMSTGVPLNHD